MSREQRGRLVAELSEACRAYRNAVDRLDEAVCECVEINRTDLRCLDVLERLGPMTAGELASSCGLTTGALTALLDRLERAGYVRRDRDEADRRKVVVSMTEVVRAKAVELYRPFVEAHETILGHLDDADLELITAFLRAELEANLDHAALLRSGA